jgi:hypothetical protein
MGVTPLSLYRSGNATSARLDRVRTEGPSRDVDTRLDAEGNIWVIANGKGMSTSDAADSDWRGIPWRLPQGHHYSDVLLVWNDAPGHWVWQPGEDMLLSDYVQALEESNRQFVKVNTR